jgi:Spy/CpxP family protein refolding chaperone
MSTIATRAGAALLGAFTMLAGCSGASPYVGQEGRDIKSLSAREVRGILAGEGMGLARAAELNGYPGPMHVLELARPLALSAEQRQRTEQLMQAHKIAVRALGAQLVEAERDLDRAFAARTVDARVVETLTARIGTLQARIRASHLTTHLTQTAILTPEQVERYGVLRGYRVE